MADVENQQESPLPVKRKADLCCQDQDSVANKAQKLQPSNSAASESKDGDNCGNMDSAEEKAEIETELVISPEKADIPAAERDELCGGGDLGGEEKQEEENGEEEEEEARREAEVDRKGKGIMRDYKGKGKLVEDDDSDEDDDEEGDDEDVESDLSDDPLAEVDLDNILPSRTRRRGMQPGLYISDEFANPDDDEDDDEDEDDDDDADDDSDDSEA